MPPSPPPCREGIAKAAGAVCGQFGREEVRACQIATAPSEACNEPSRYQVLVPLALLAAGQNFIDTSTSFDVPWYGEAEPLYQEALQVRREVLGPRHPGTLTSLDNLAALYRDQGRYGEAEPLHQEALQRPRRATSSMAAAAA
jgi:hypothetical protein